MSRFGIASVLSLVAGLAIAMPLAARSNAGNNQKSTVTAKMDIVNDATVGGKEVKAGTYDVKVNETKVTLLRDGKVIAEAPVEWKEEPTKSSYSSIIVDSGAVKEIHFTGKTKYAQLTEGTSSVASGGQQ